MELDHIVLGTRNLEALAAEICERLSARSSDPKTFPSLGFRTVTVFTDPPLELCAITDPHTAGREAWTASLSARITNDEPLIAWAVRVPDVATEAARLGLHVRPSATFDTVGLDEAYGSGLVPFFISYRGARPAWPGGAGGSRLAAAYLADSERRLDHWLGDATGLPLRLVEGRPGLTALEFEAPQGRWVFSADAAVG